MKIDKHYLIGGLAIAAIPLVLAMSFVRVYYLDQMEKRCIWRCDRYEKAVSKFMDATGRVPSRKELLSQITPLDGILYWPTDDGYMIVATYKSNLDIRIRRDDIRYNIARFPRLYTDPRISVSKHTGGGAWEPIYPVFPEIDRFMLEHSRQEEP